MTKLTMEISDLLLQAIKDFISVSGQTIEEFFIEAAMERLKNNSK